MIPNKVSSPAMAFRLLVYALESSGASTFCLMLGQVPDSVPVVDLWSQCIAPPLRLDKPIVVKATANALYQVGHHIASFRPDRTILFLRDPAAVYSSLRKYHYANQFGTVEQKLARFDAEFGGTTFDLVLRYEDFLDRDPALLAALQRIGWPSTAEHYRLDRSIDEIRAHNFSQSDWLREEYEHGWGFGNFKGGEIRQEPDRTDYPAETVEAVRRVAPRMTGFYERFPRRPAEIVGCGHGPVEQPKGINFVTAYPKSGITFLNFMLFHALFGRSDEAARIDSDYIVDLHQYPETAAPSDGNSSFVKCHFPYGPSLPLRERAERAVLLVRDPIDLMMSLWDYKHLTSEEGINSLTAEARADKFRNFVEHWITSGGLGYDWAGSWVDNVEAWLGQTDIPLLVVRYEALRERPAEEVARCLAFLGRPVDDAALAAAVSFGSVDNMRDHETREAAKAFEGAFYRHDLKEGYEQGYRFVGRLHQGSYRTMLSEAQRARVDARFGPTLARIRQRAGT